MLFMLMPKINLWQMYTTSTNMNWKGACLWVMLSMLGKVWTQWCVCRNQVQNTLTSGDASAVANDLNIFYARFDIFRDFVVTCPVTVDEQEVVKCLSRIKPIDWIIVSINPINAPGPGGLKGIVIKLCAKQLVVVFSNMFRLFLKCGFHTSFMKIVYCHACM